MFFEEWRMPCVSAVKLNLCHDQWKSSTCNCRSNITGTFFTGRKIPSASRLFTRVTLCVSESDIRLAVINPLFCFCLEHLPAADVSSVPWRTDRWKRTVPVRWVSLKIFYGGHLFPSRQYWRKWRTGIWNTLSNNIL